MSRAKSLVAALLAAAAIAAASLPAFADSSGPFAGNSGHFQNPSVPCQQSDSNPHCPPFGK